MFDFLSNSWLNGIAYFLVFPKTVEETDLQLLPANKSLVVVLQTYIESSDSLFLVFIVFPFLFVLYMF